MKRSMTDDTARISVNGDQKLKKIRLEEVGEEEMKKENGESCHGGDFVNFDENLLYEIFKHVDARSLAMASCVSKLWNRTAQDERLWELICTRHWSQVGSGAQQLRSVVLTLGGFRRLYSLYLWQLSEPQVKVSPSPSSLYWAAVSPPRVTTKVPVKPALKNNVRWGKDEVHLSLGLLSIRYFEKMSGR